MNRELCVSRLIVLIPEAAGGKLTLTDVTSKGTGRPIQSWTIPRDANLDEWLGARLDEANAIAMDETETAGGPLRWELAVWQPGGRMSLGSYTFRETTDHDVDLAPRGGDMVNAAIVREAFRHTEGATRAGIASLKDVNSTLRELLEEERKETERLRKVLRENEDLHLKVWQEYQTLLSQTHDRKLASLTFENEQKRDDEILDLVMTLAPHLLSYWVGGEKGNAGIDSIAMDQLLATFDQEQLNAILPHFTDPQRIAVLEILLRGKKRYEQKNVARTLKAPEPPDAVQTTAPSTSQALKKVGAS